MLLSNLSCEELLRYAHLEAKTPLETALLGWLDQAVPNMAQLAEVQVLVTGVDSLYSDVEENPSLVDLCGKIETIIDREPMMLTETVASLICNA